MNEPAFKKVFAGQMVDLSGWLAVENAVLLLDLIRRTGARTALEIGTFNGLSTVLLASRLDSVTTIDTFAGSGEAYMQNGVIKTKVKSQRQTLEGNLRAFGVRDKVVVITATSDQAAEMLKRRQFDLVYIDGSHEHDQVLRDLTNFYPMARKVICGDDYTEQWPGVRAAVDQAFGDKADRNQRLWFVLK